MRDASDIRCSSETLDNLCNVSCNEIRNFYEPKKCCFNSHAHKKYEIGNNYVTECNWEKNA